MNIMLLNININQRSTIYAIHQTLKRVVDHRAFKSICIKQANNKWRKKEVILKNNLLSATRSNQSNNGRLDILFLQSILEF